ncbi:hypothetical protein BT1A1_0566 [Caldibacillus thermoamylovorans]|uniref:Uncharacterized protein n=1 Tax=Caldibacillus thermoamylovorans TaxID=35841 RepID=A0A090IQU9_9BACI|nr:hypothetical protein BT1A1_0566 [Caldibacillus thermoamylovorans]
METRLFSRYHYEAENAYFWRRSTFSSSFLHGKPPFLATRPFLVVFLKRKTSFFGDEALSRRLFELRNPTFWRRDPFSSSFLHGKLPFLATRPFLVVFLSQEIPLFGDETFSRHHFCTGNPIFWRRDLFSSSFLHGKPHFLATRSSLVVFLSRETLIFGDETRSRRLFLAGNSLFWRRNPFSSSFFGWKLIFLATRSSLVVFLKRKTPFFGDETFSRRHFCTGNPLFWRRDLFSSSFLHGKPPFLATRPFLVITFARETPFFGDETFSRRHFCTGNPLFWRRSPFSSLILPEIHLFLATKPSMRQKSLKETLSNCPKIKHFNSLTDKFFNCLCQLLNTSRKHGIIIR